jgi:NitT/TauT family transport system ATP-binding protein
VEKVLALREPVLTDRRSDVEALIRALVRTGKHFVDPENWDANAAILARAEYLDASPGLIRHAISDRLPLERGGKAVPFSDFMFQYREAANFPWVSQASWLYSQMVRWDRMEFDLGDAEKAARVFRPDIYRSALKGSGEPLPGASSKVEGSLGGPLAVGTQQGAMTLTSDRFFDNSTFDPADVAGYLARLP